MAQTDIPKTMPMKQGVVLVEPVPEHRVSKANAMTRTQLIYKQMMERVREYYLKRPDWTPADPWLKIADCRSEFLTALGRSKDTRLSDEERQEAWAESERIKRRLDSKRNHLQQYGFKSDYSYSVRQGVLYVAYVGPGMAIHAQRQRAMTHGE